jgi:hypothetical protein
MPAQSDAPKRRARPVCRSEGSLHGQAKASIESQYSLSSGFATSFPGAGKSNSTLVQYGLRERGLPCGNVRNFADTLECGLDPSPLGQFFGHAFPQHWSAGTLNLEFLNSHVLDFGHLCKRNLAFMAPKLTRFIPKHPPQAASSRSKGPGDIPKLFGR